MREPGLSEAIRAAGGVSELARRLGIAQPSVSNWDKVPAERVAAVETATGVSRAILRPDLFGDRPGVNDDVDEVAAARSREYALLGLLLSKAPDQTLLKALARIVVDASPLGVAHAALSRAAAETSLERIEREYFDLFIGLGRGELLPYGSYYLTGFLHERPLARLRVDLAELGIAKVEDNPEPEDHIAILCEIMAGIVGERYAAPAGTDQRIFDKHLAPWAPRFFADLEQAEAGDFYRRVGTVGRLFMQIETEAFALPA